MVTTSRTNFDDRVMRISGWSYFQGAIASAFIGLCTGLIALFIAFEGLFGGMGANLVLFAMVGLSLLAPFGLLARPERNVFMVVIMSIGSGIALAGLFYAIRAGSTPATLISSTFLVIFVLASLVFLANGFNQWVSDGKPT